MFLIQRFMGPPSVGIMVAHRLRCVNISSLLKVIYHPLYGMNNYVLIWGDWLSEGHKIANHPIYGVIGYHVTLSEGHKIANHPIYGGDWLLCDPLRGSHDSQSPHIKQ